MASRTNVLLVSVVVLSCLAATCFGEVYFHDLKHTLIVTSSPKEGEVLKAGEDTITATWVLNQSYPAGTDSSYKRIKVKLCYAPISQKDRAWRNTEDDLFKDKTCQFTVIDTEYNPSNKSIQSVTWIVEKDVPQATYFLRAYAYDAKNHEVAYGQSTNDLKTTHLFNVQAITGRHASLDIAAAVFSAFSIVSLFGFFYNEKRNAKNK